MIREFRGNIPQGQPLSKEEVSGWLIDAKILNFHFVLEGEKQIVVFEYDGWGSTYKGFVLTDRENRDDLIGYAWIQKISPNIWQVGDVHIYDPYKRRGLGFDLYVKLINEGYKLINGFSLSTEVEGLWRKLHTKVNVNTFDLQTKEISEFDERAKEDDSQDNHNQRYFWIGSSKSSNLKESLWINDEINIKRYYQWLRNEKCIPPGNFGAARYGEEGDL